MDNLLYRKRIQRSRHSYLFENNRKLTEIEREMVGNKIIQFRRDKAKVARVKKNLEKINGKKLLVTPNFYKDPLQYKDCESITVRADKIPKVDLFILVNLGKFEI